MLIKIKLTSNANETVGRRRTADATFVELAHNTELKSPSGVGGFFTSLELFALLNCGSFLLTASGKISFVSSSAGETAS